MEEYLENYMKPGVPVVIRNALSSNCLWDLDFLIEKVGHRDVHIRRNTSHENYKVGKAYDTEKMKFSKYATMIKENHEESPNYYLAAVNIKTEFPELEPLLEVPIYTQKVHHGPYLWVSSKDHYEFCHVDSDDGVLCMLSGKKKIRLYNYRYFSNLSPNPLGSKGRTIQSRINIDNPDPILFPTFREAVCEECTLSPGDILFIPSFYWHQVQSNHSVSINYFCGDNGENDFLQKLITTRWESFSYWFDNILEQNRNLLDKLMSDFARTLKQFFMSQFREMATDEQLEILINHAIEKFSLDPATLSVNLERKHATRLKIRGLLWRSNDK